MDSMKDCPEERRALRAADIELWSFGFKYGVMEADAMIDVRFLPNPYYDNSLRFFTGRNAQCSAFVFQHESCRAFAKSLAEFIMTMRESADAHKKPVLKVAIGCTGGQHRSVAIIEELARLLLQAQKRGKGVRVEVHHRDAAKWVLSDQTTASI